MSALFLDTGITFTTFQNTDGPGLQSVEAKSWLAMGCDRSGHIWSSAGLFQGKDWSERDAFLLDKVNELNARVNSSDSNDDSAELDDDLPF